MSAATVVNTKLCDDDAFYFEISLSKIRQDHVTCWLWSLLSHSVSYLSPYSHNRILLYIMDEDSWISSVPVFGSAYSRKTMSTSRLYVAKPSGILLGGYLSLCCDLLTLRWYSQTAEVRALVTFIVTWIDVIIQPHWCQSIRIHHWPSPKAPRWNNVYMVCKTF